jgi:hypothetical protein
MWAAGWQVVDVGWCAWMVLAACCWQALAAQEQLALSLESQQAPQLLAGWLGQQAGPQLPVAWRVAGALQQAQEVLGRRGAPRRCDCSVLQLRRAIALAVLLPGAGGGAVWPLLLLPSRSREGREQGRDRSF